MQPKKRYYKFFYMLATILVLYFGFCFISAKQYLNPARKSSHTPPVGFKDTHISGPGYQLPAWTTVGLLTRAPVSDTVFVLVHGYQGQRDGWRYVAQGLAKEGQEVIVPVLRAHETSPIGGCTFGKKEATDILAAVRWARERYNKPANVVLVGKSMGGSAVWYASAIDPSVDAVVSDAAFARFDEAGRSWLKGMFWGANILFRPVYWIADKFYHVKAEEINPVEEAKNWRGRPALVIHGEKDPLLDLSHATRLAEAAACPLWVVKGAKHEDCSMVNLNLYVQKLLEIATKAKTRKAEALIYIDGQK